MKTENSIIENHLTITADRPLGKIILYCHPVRTECKINQVYLQGITVIGRSLIRTFLAGATQNAAVYEMSDEQAQKKKM